MTERPRILVQALAASAIAFGLLPPSIHAAEPVPTRPEDVQHYIEVRPYLRQQMTVPREQAPALLRELDLLICQRNEVRCMDFRTPGGWVPSCTSPDAVLGPDLSEFIAEIFGVSADTVFCSSVLNVILQG